MNQSDELCVVPAARLAPRPADEPPWLIEGLFSRGAVGVIGGAPKSMKSWLSLEMAVAVASGHPCLGHFETLTPGPALLYAAEDAPVDVRDRIAGLAEARGVDFASLDVGVIVEPSLRLDRPDHVRRLRATLSRHRPRLLILDPYVRLQSLDENNSTEVSMILATLRELSRSFETAVVLVHHARKSPADHSGQALRGSSDFHAWGDSNLYLRWRREELILSIEHRAAASPPPLALSLVADDGPVRLEVRDIALLEVNSKPLPERVLDALDGSTRRQEDLRTALRVRNQRITEVLRELERQGRIVRRPHGWARVDTVPEFRSLKP